VPNDPNCDRTEQPRSRAVIEEPFAVMTHEVTWGNFRAYATATSRSMPRQPEWYADEKHPVVNVTWDEAQLYCQSLGGRLPTEAEWEYAARGGPQYTLYPWGNEIYQPRPKGAPPIRRAAQTGSFPVGTFAPNGYGLYDMAGNVWEWTVNRHRPTHDTEPVDDGYELRTIKGGSWDSSPARRRISERAALARHGRHNLYVGFRCVRTLAP
jgi:formylglycine-generating enzyme required for sulfatase activity